jgi:hypothetical protein
MMNEENMTETKRKEEKEVNKDVLIGVIVLDRVT